MRSLRQLPFDVYLGCFALLLLGRGTDHSSVIYLISYLTARKNSSTAAKSQKIRREIRELILTPGFFDCIVAPVFILTALGSLRTENQSASILHTGNPVRAYLMYEAPNRRASSWRSWESFWEFLFTICNDWLVLREDNVVSCVLVGWERSISDRFLVSKKV